MPRLRIRRLAIAAAIASLPIAPALAQDFKVTLNAPYDGSNAAFFLADEKGYYAAEGLKLSMDPSNGSGEVATRIGGGTYDFGFGDINVLMEFNAKNPDNAGKAVYMLYYRSPLSVASLTKAHIAQASDLNGKKLGGALTDGAYKLFPAYSALTNVKADSIQWSYGDLRLRETMLLRAMSTAFWASTPPCISTWCARASRRPTSSSSTTPMPGSTFTETPSSHRRRCWNPIRRP
jgi:NitT/TauT family transport system substrate-binding protein